MLMGDFKNILELFITHRQDIDLVLHPLYACDESEQKVHDRGGGQVGEQQLRELGLLLDVLDHLETCVLIAVPVLNILQHVTTLSLYKKKNILKNLEFHFNEDLSSKSRYAYVKSINACFKELLPSQNEGLVRIIIENLDRESGSQYIGTWVSILIFT